jgi:hypothetical protein
MVVDEGKLGRQHGARVELHLLLEDQPFEHDALGDVAIADRARERRDGALPNLPGGKLTDDSRRQLIELPDRQRRIHRRAGGARAAAELGVAHPEVDADRLALVLVDSGRAERRPAPRPDRVGAQLLRHLPHGQRLELHDLEPLRARLQAFAAARARRRLELELERNPARRNPDLGEAPDERAHPAAHRPARADGTERMQLRHVRGGEEDLPDEQRFGCQVPPPLRRLAARVRRVRDRDRRKRAALLQPANEGKRVRAVLRGRRRPRRRRLRPEELVQRDPGSRTAGHHDGEVEQAICAVRDRRRIGGHRRRPDAVVEVEVEEDRCRTVLARLGRLDRPGRERKRQSRLLRQRRIVACEVDPERIRVGDAALARERAPRQNQGGAGGGKHDGEAHAPSCSLGTGRAGTIVRVSTGSISAKSRRAGRSRWFERLGRVGLVAKAVLYAVIGLLAIQVARGGREESPDKGGALRTIAEQPFGKGLLVLLAVGLAAYALWRLAQGILDRDSEGEGAKGLVKRAAALGKAGWYGILCGLTVSTLVGNGSGGGNEQQTTEGVFERPFGRYLVYAAGLAFIGAAAFNGWRAVTCKFNKKLKTGQMSDAGEKAATGVGILGHLARMIVFGLIGVFLVRAAWEYDSRRARGLDGALLEVAQAPYGGPLLGAVAVGLLAYAAYCLVQARYRRI